MPAIKTDSDSQTAKAVRGGSALATNAAVIAVVVRQAIPPSPWNNQTLADNASNTGDMSKDHDTGISMRLSPAQLRTADEESFITRDASLRKAAFAQPSPTKDIGSHTGSPLASSSLQPKTVHSGQLPGSRALAASPNGVITDGDSWDTRVNAVGAVVETATVTITADMKELEEIAESFGMGITWPSEDDVVLQAIPLSPGNNQTRSPWCASSLQAEVVNHSMKKGKEI